MYLRTKTNPTIIKKFIDKNLTPKPDNTVISIIICGIIILVGPVPNPIIDGNKETPRATIGSNFNFLANNTPIGTIAIKASVPAKAPK